ncbi:MAG: sigma-54-dependent Fis family transcriptional regulator, partial [Sphaerochaetaceae bacterium]|nr:sigma-54-dependent Fis family transcriptional regulator [Sphaerochaetaceae bacterium]
LTVPPLRERKEDIPLLMTAFLEQINNENGRDIKGFTDAAKHSMLSYDWPGNIRELRNCVEAAVVLSRNDLIEVGDLPLQVRKLSENPSITVDIGTSLADTEKQLILETLAAVNGNKTKAAEILKIGRKTLHRKIEEYSKTVDK